MKKREGEFKTIVVSIPIEHWKMLKKGVRKHGQISARVRRILAERFKNMGTNISSYGGNK